MFVDFHCHSDHSDGTDSVAAIVQKAADKGISILSVTDHDTLAGQNEARELCLRAGIKYIRGVEDPRCSWLRYGFRSFVYGRRAQTVEA